MFEKQSKYLINLNTMPEASADIMPARPVSKGWEANEQTTGSRMAAQPNTNPGRMTDRKGRRYFIGTDVPASRFLSTVAGLGLVASGLGMAYDKVTDRFDSGQNYRMGAIVEPVRHEESGVKIVPLENKPENKTIPNSQAEASVYRNFALARIEGLMNLGKLSEQDKSLFILKVNEMRKVIEGNPSFDGMKTVMTNHSDELINFANKYNVPPEIVLSCALIENGGAEGMVSPAGARGVLQVMPDLLSDKLKQRRMTLDQFNNMSQKGQDVLLSEIGVENLHDMYSLFGDWGLAVWAHHGGQGNVYSALKVYFGHEFDANNLPPGGFPVLESFYKEKVQEAKKYGFNFFTLLENPKVQKEVLVNLVDETELYTLKAIAANIIINEQLPPIIEKVLARQTASADQWREKNGPVT